MKVYKANFLAFNLLYLFLFLASFIFNYLWNVNYIALITQACVWFFGYLMAVSFLINIEILSLAYPTKLLSISVILILIFPAMFSIIAVSESSYHTFGTFLLIILIIIEIILLGLGFTLISLYKSSKFTAVFNNLVLIRDQKGLIQQDKAEISSEPQEFLGRGDSVIDKVINSIMHRANLAIKSSKFSLAVMVVLVVIGGGLSIGTIALDQFSKVRELESHRQALLKVADELVRSRDRLNRLAISPFVPDATIFYKKDSAVSDSINAIIKTTYGEKNFYKDLLEKIDKQGNFSVTEIIMRVSLAALTLFLVQVFFQIYRYNQQQSTSLMTKAEVMELFKETDADKKVLRETLASKLEENPKFGKSPSTPIEQIINIVEKTKGATH